MIKVIEFIEEENNENCLSSEKEFLLLFLKDIQINIFYDIEKLQKIIKNREKSASLYVSSVPINFNTKCSFLKYKQIEINSTCAGDFLVGDYKFFKNFEMYDEEIEGVVKSNNNILHFFEEDENVPISLLLVKTLEKLFKIKE
jgi:hypothetical protein